jgi:hypothetical protein
LVNQITCLINSAVSSFTDLQGRMVSHYSLSI